MERRRADGRNAAASRNGFFLSKRPSPRTIRVLATDYDGTIATHGRVDPPALAATQDWRRRGGLALLATGRRLADLLQSLPDPLLFDRIVAEDGAVLFDPSSGRRRCLAPPISDSFISALARRRVPFGRGDTIVSSARDYAEIIQSVIREIDAPYHLTFNRGSVMAIPTGLDKGAGLSAALTALQVDEFSAAAIGDAENDIPLIESCGWPGAVANAIDAVKKRAAWITRDERGAGFSQFVDALLKMER